MLSKLSFLLLVFLFAASTQADFIQPLTRTPLRPFSVNQNYTTDYSFSALIPSDIPNQAFIEVEFPLPYSIPSACQVSMKTPQNSTYINYSCTKTTASKYLINASQIVSGEYDFVFQNIENPSAYPASSNFKIKTYYNQEILVDSNEYFDSVPFLPTPIISYGASVQNLGYNKVNLGSKFDFTFVLTKALKKGDSMKVNFPVGFYFVKPACFHRNSGSYTSAEVLYNNRMLICQSFLFDIPANQSQIVSIIGVVNPDHVGFFLGSFLETMEGLTPNILEKVLVNNPIQIVPGGITVEVISKDLLLAMNTTHQFNILFDDDVPASAEVWIKIPSGFRYLAPNCTLLRPLQPAPDSEVTCELAANNTGYIIRGFSGISDSQLVSVLINAENPAVQANYTVQIYSYSTQYQAKIDEGFVDIALDGTYGSSRFFKSHALKFTRKLMYNETGPFEFTFFLNIPLPATTSTFEGKIVVDVKPQIPYPPVGTLRCFFNNTVPGDCTWNTSRPDRTTITIFTPSTESYFQSEIPITVTTETDVGTLGIKLPELIQRYKFYFYFYRNGETEFHEVYYEDWVPDPITMPDNWYTSTFAPLQYGQESYLKIAFTNNYLALGTNYFFELAFDHSNNAWDFNLGWPALQWYEKHEMPCIGEGLGPNVRCFLTPGGAQFTTSYIQMIGLSEIAFGQTFNLHFPKIKFGTSDTAYLVFTLYENTPGENTLKIPIITRNMNFAPSAARTYVDNTFTTLTVNPNQPNFNSTLTMRFVSTSNPQYTIYNYPDLFTFTTGLVNCGGNNLCYAFNGTNVNWLVFQPNPLQGTDTLTTTTILTAPYVGTYTFSARTVSAGGVVQDTRSSTMTLNPGALTVTLRTNTANPEINSNSILLFDVLFTTVTHLPANASVEIDFTQLTVPQGDSFYCQVVAGLTGFDARGVAGRRIDTNTIRLSNLAETAAGTAVSLTFQLQTNTQAAVSGVVNTYYLFNGTNRVDRGTGSATLTFANDNFLNATLFNDRSGEIVRVGKTGIFNFAITPTKTYTTATVAVTFDTGFDVTATTDVLLCRINNRRRRCTYTRNPLVVTITGLISNSFTASTLTNISISSDFETSLTQGIVAPTTAGWHPVNVAILVNSVIQEKIGDYIYIYPALIPLLSVSAVPATASQYAMYTFSITMRTNLNTNLNSGVRGRMFIDFPTGTEGFANDLGTGLSTGEYVGCNIQGLTTLTNIHCRLVASLGNGAPASVEVIGFDAITAGTAFTIRVAKIKNPSTTAGEYVFAFRTDQYTASTGVATPLEYTRYSLWNYVTPITGTLPSYNSPDEATFQTQAVAGQSQTSLTIDLYAGRALAVGDYYVYDLPSSVVPDVTLTCPATVSNCWSFPDAGWVVYQLSQALPAATVRDGTINTITIPARLNPRGYTFLAYAWRSNQLDHTINFGINSTTFTTLVGNIQNRRLTITADQLVRNRKDTEAFVEFTPSVAIPNTGSIQITFPAGFTAHANCKSSLSAGSGLTSTTGRVACAVQGTSWIVTNFDQVAANTPIKIFGLIDLPATAGTYNLQVRTFANQDADLANNGQQLETATTGFGLQVAAIDTLSLDVSPTTLVNKRIPATTTSYHPLIFDFAVTQAAATTIQLRVDGSATGFSATRPTGEPYICYFEELNTSAVTACTVTTSRTNSILTFTLTPSVALTVNTNYRAFITTAFAANGNDGVVFPTSAQVYKAALVVTTGTAQQTDISFFEIVPVGFASLIVKSYVIALSQENVIDIDLTTPTGSTITTTERLVIELPTTFNGTAMFDEDIGQGLTDNANKPCDVIASVPTGLTMSCFFQKGNRNAGTPASIVVYGFSIAFSRLRLAFTVNNPAVTTSTVIPLTIYSMLGTNAFTKTFYQYIENAVIVRSAAATQSANQQTRPTYSVSTFGSQATLTIDLLFTGAMTTSDYYVIKTPEMSASGQGSVATITTSFGTAEAVVMPQSQYIVVRSTGGQVAAGTYSVTIPGVYNPDRVLSTSESTFSAVFSSFANFATTLVTYATGTVRTTLPSNPTVTLTPLNTQRESTMTITINTVFKGVRTVIIDLGTRVSVENECYEGSGSAIQILQCATVPASNRIIVTLEANTFPTTSSALVVRLPTRNGGTAGAVDGISYYFYSTVETNPTVTTGQLYAATNIAPGVTLTTVAPSAAGPTLAEFVYAPYSENRQGLVSGTYGDLIVSATLTAAVTAGQEVRVTLDNFGISVDTTNIGDVSGSAAAIITTGGSSVMVPATIQNQNIVSITLPTGTNLNAGATTFRITQMSAAGDQAGVICQTTTTNQPQVTMDIYDINGNQLRTENSAQVDSFLTRNLNPAQSPIRLRFQVAGAVGRVIIQLPANDYNYDTTSNAVCYFRRYTTILDYVETQAQACTITGTLTAGFTVTADSNGALTTNTLYELVVETDSTTSPYFNRLANSNKQAVVGFYNAALTLISSTNIFLYQYQANPLISIADFYYTTDYNNDPNTLIFQMNVRVATTTYPASLIELELTSASSALLQSGMTQGTVPLKCGIVGPTKRTASVDNLRCSIIPTSPPRVRIENYQTLTASSTVYLVLYDLDNSVIANDFVSSFSANLIVTNLATNVQSQHRLTRMFTTLAGSVVSAAQTLPFPTSSSTTYGSTTVLSEAITWLNGDSCNPCRFIVRGLNTDYKFPSTSFTFRIGTDTETTIVDAVNNIFVVLSAVSPMTQGTQYTFQFRGANMRTPQSYERNSGTIQVELFSNQHSQRIYNLTGSYPTLQSTTLTTTTTAACTVYANAIPGTKGNVDCVVTVPLGTGTTAISGIMIDLPNTGGAQYSEVYNYCNAFVASGNATALKSMLSCSRQDPSTTNARFFISGFQYVSGSTISFTLRARAIQATTITATVQLQAVNTAGAYYTVGQETNRAFDISTVFATTYAAPTTFSMLETYEARVTASSTSPLRVITDFGANLNAAGSVVMTLGASFGIATGRPLCTIKDITTYGAPYLTSCSYAANVYTLSLFNAIPAGRYLIEVTTLQQNMVSEGVTFPTDTRRTSLLVQVNSAANTLVSSDLTYLAAAPAIFPAFSLAPQRDKIPLSNSQFDVNIRTSTQINADTTSEENIIVLEFPTTEYDTDLGASTTTFSADNLPYYNGMAFSGYFSGLGTSAVSSLHYGTTTEPALVVVSGIAGIAANTATVTGLSYIKNPALGKGMSAKISIVKYASGEYFPTVLYEAQYTNFYNTINALAETTPALTIAASSMTPYVSMTLTFSGKNYGTDVDTTSRIYIKLKNAAAGFEYDTIQSITCTGYSVEWHKENYILFLTPLTDLGTQSPTIVCTGFVLGTNTNDIEIETGIHKEGYGRIAASFNTVPVGTQATTLVDNLEATRVGDIPNVQSVNLYQIKYDPQSFKIQAGTYFVIQIPSGLQVIPGRTEYITYTSLTDDTTTTTAVHATLINGNIMVSGYAAYTTQANGLMTIQFFLRNIASGNQQFMITFYDANGNEIIQSSLSQAVTVATTPNPVVAGTFGPYLTDNLDVYGTEQYPFKFLVQVRNAMTSGTNGRFIVTLPTGFTLTSGQQVCKYSRDNGVHWIRSTTSTVAGSTMTIPLETGFDLQANDNVIIILTTESNDATIAGIVRPNTPQINTFHITSQRGTTVLESVYLPLVVYPLPVDVATTWYTRGAGQESIVSLTFTVASALTANDFFQLELISNDEIDQVFPNDLGTGSTESRILGNCARDPSSSVISDNVLIDCYITPGVGNANPFTNVNARVITQNSKAIAANTRIRYLIAGIENPATVIPGGFVFNVMRPCRNDGYGCPLFRRRDYSSILRALSTTPTAMPVPTLPTGSTDLFTVGVRTTFTLDLASAVATSDAVVIKTDLPNMALQSVCTSPSGSCINFPRLGWTFFQPSVQLTTGQKSFSVLLDNALFYDRTHNLDFTAETWVSGRVTQVFTSDHPNYNVMIPPLLTNATQADPEIQRIVRNFDNILMLSMTSIWRTDMVRRILVNIPSSYAPIADGYCMAGVNLDDISSPNYTEFACEKTGDRQMLIVIDDQWEPLDSSLNVVLYYRGLLRVNATAGWTSTSTITSYASLDPALEWVVDENTGYQFYVDPVPTPIIRDVNLNLKSFNDRKAQILDYVEFYGAIWPYTPFDPNNNQTKITQILFQVDDAFSYPALSNLLCYMKVIYRQQVNCTLSRKSGRSEILMEMPPDYEHGPFLFRITNTQENLLFKAPDHEGEFPFNMTMENQYGGTVEQANSYMEISGEQLSNFSAQPILIDPLVQTLYDIEFVTQGRSIPQGFMEPGQDVSTQIVLSFQTYAPAFPLDLGTGLADGSEISCIPVQGITVTKSGNLTCILSYGTPSDHARITITNYDAISALTTVIIYIDGISTLALNQTSRIQLDVLSTYAGSTDQYQFYYSQEVSPTEPTASIAKSPAALQISRAGSTNLRETSSYNFTFTTTTALTANQDYIIIEFPEYGYEQDADYSSVLINIATPSSTSNGYVMPKRNIIYVKPSVPIPAGQVVVSISNLPNPSFVLTGASTFTVSTAVNRKTVDVFTNTFTYSSQTCQLFSDEKVTYGSNFARINENTYQISFTMDHDVPEDGSIAVIFDPNLYNLKPSDPRCQLISGFSSQATCEFELFSQQLVRVNMNGVALQSGTQVQINVLNVNNPIDSTTSPIITIQSYFDAEFGTTKTICSKNITLPSFNAVNLVQCPIDIQPEINNANQVTAYLINVYCSTSVRNATTLDIQFPTDFLSSFSTDLSCSTNGNYMLAECSLIARTSRVTILISQPDIQTPLVVRVRNVKNPSLPGTYGPFAVNLYQYEVQYGELDPVRSSATVNIVSDRNDVINSDNLALSIYPKNFGEKAVYYFNLIGLEPNKVPSAVLIQFDKDFAQDIGPSIECGTFTPQEQFGDSYALNYESLQDLNMLECSMIDNELVQMQLTPIINMVAGQAQDIFFFIKNVVNPSLAQESVSTSYNFNFTFILNQSAVLISTNTVPIEFALPPSLLEISKVDTTETNILSPASYTLSFTAIQNLPVSIDSETNDYELHIAFSTSQFPNIQQETLSYSFINNSVLLADSSAFMIDNAVYIRADYPDFASSGPFLVSFENMTNPDVESQCGSGAQGLPVKFESQYVNREEGLVFGRTYNIMDQGNCLSLDKNRSAIKVVAPLYLRQGLVYTFALQVEEPASDLSITPISNFLIFEPTTVTFADYKDSRLELKVQVSKYVPEGEYTIKWKKNETSDIIQYLEIEDTNVIVVSESTSGTVTPLPNVEVESIRYVWTGKMPRDVTITLSQEPADEITLEINTKVVDTKLQASLDGVSFSNLPITVTFGSGDLSKKFFIFAEDGAKDNVLTYTLTGDNANVFDSNIPNEPFAIRNRQGVNTFQIFSIQSLLVNENNADYLISLSDIGTVYYLAVVKNAMTPTLLDLIQGNLVNVETKYYQAGSLEVEKVQGGTALLAYINFTSLAAQTNYQVYFVARSVYGEYTAIQMKEIETRKISDGANLLIPTLGAVDPDYLIEALSIILPIAKSRLYFSEAEEYPQEDGSDPVIGSQLDEYKITIAPDQYQNDPTPNEIAQTLLTQEKLTQLFALVPQFYIQNSIRITPVKRASPQLIVAPTVSSVGYYNLVINIELIDIGKVYAVITPSSVVGDLIPTSYQIANGLAADNTQVSPDFYQMLFTNENGNAQLVFGELRDFVEYNVYITAGSDVPYEPAELLADSSVSHLTITTLKNPNVGTFSQANALYEMYYDRILENYGNRIRTMFMSLFVIIAAMMWF